VRSRFVARSRQLDRFLLKLSRKGSLLLLHDPFPFCGESTLLSLLPPLLWVKTRYIWRQSGSQWTDEELALLRAHYPTMARAELLRLFPSRSWQAIVSKAINESIPKQVIKRNDGLAVPTNTSLTDLAVVNEFMLEPGKRVQWQHYHQERQTSNEDGISYWA
jgi:hypothetical protein